MTPRGAWKKGGYRGDGGSRCLIQAINDCDGKNAEAAKQITLTAIKKVTGMNVTSIPGFNDAKATTKMTVLDVLDEAIELSKKKGVK